jgi:hypothetical protein
MFNLLKRALWKGGDNYTASDVADAIRNGKAQVFQHGDSVVVTEIVDHPRRKELNLWLAAGNWDELTALDPTLKEYGRKHGCERIVAHCRRGLTQRMKAIGFREHSRTFVMEI